MSKEKRKDNHNEAAGDNPAFVVKKDRLGVFLKHWGIVKSYAPNSLNSHISSYRAGKVIFNDKELEDLLGQGAPIAVYTRDAD